MKYRLVDTLPRGREGQGGESNARLMLRWQRIRGDGEVKRLKRWKHECLNRVLTMES
jgi:hypothetical protein